MRPLSAGTAVSPRAGSAAIEISIAATTRVVVTVAPRASYAPAREVGSQHSPPAGENPSAPLARSFHSPRPLQRLRSYRVARRPVAHLGPRLVAMSLAEDVAQVGHQRKRVRMLARMTIVGAKIVRRPQHQRLGILEARLLDVLARRALADLPLHVHQPAFLDR